MYTIPPATIGPGPLIDAPFAATPLTVSKSRLVSYSHSSDPSLVDQPRTAPSFDPVNTTPGITVIAARTAALQPRAEPHLGGGGGAIHARSPVVSFTAWRPPGCVDPSTSETAKYA